MASYSQPYLNSKLRGLLGKLPALLAEMRRPPELGRRGRHRAAAIAALIVLAAGVAASCGGGGGGGSASSAPVASTQQVTSITASNGGNDSLSFDGLPANLGTVSMK